MTDEKRPSRSFYVFMAVVTASGVAIGFVSQRGFTLEVLPLILGALLLWGVIWTGGFQLGAAFADWLEKRWHK